MLAGLRSTSGQWPHCWIEWDGQTTLQSLCCRKLVCVWTAHVDMDVYVDHQSKVFWSVKWTMHIGMTFKYHGFAGSEAEMEEWCWWCAPQPTTNQGLNGYMGERDLGYYHLNPQNWKTLELARICTNNPNSQILARFTINGYNEQLYL